MQKLIFSRPTVIPLVVYQCAIFTPHFSVKHISAMRYEIADFYYNENGFAKHIR